MTQLPSYCTFD